ncbi:uncharacterized protein [Epargyreus clarus]|uniref:uncharacterized protein n=1 Tax=Epargyreus clarus TaxID=520877 RepID=UPI003C2BBC1D
MKRITLLFILIVFVTLYEAKDLVVGSRVNNLLVNTEKVETFAIPFIRRDKDYSYTDPKKRIIKGIIARDLSRTEGEVTVIDGGVDHTHVTLHLTSGKGEKLNYLILIFSKNS